MEPQTNQIPVPQPDMQASQPSIVVKKKHVFLYVVLASIILSQVAKAVISMIVVGIASRYGGIEIGRYVFLGLSIILPITIPIVMYHRRKIKANTYGPQYALDVENENRRIRIRTIWAGLLAFILSVFILPGLGLLLFMAACMAGGGC